MTQLIAFIAAHKILFGAFAWLLFNNLVSNMPEPMPAGSPLYKYFYGVLHGIAGNADKYAPILKGLFGMKSIAIIALCLLSISAAAQTPAPSPKAKTKQSTTLVKKTGAGLKFVFSHPISDLKGILTPPLLAIDAGADVAHKGFQAADVATGVGSGKVFGIIHGFFHGGNVVSGKIDDGADWVEKTFGIPLDSDD